MAPGSPGLALAAVWSPSPNPAFSTKAGPSRHRRGLGCSTEHVVQPAGGRGGAGSPPEQVPPVDEYERGHDLELAPMPLGEGIRLRWDNGNVGAASDHLFQFDDRIA